jgi:hypothetical protein
MDEYSAPANPLCPTLLSAQEEGSIQESGRPYAARFFIAFGSISWIASAANLRTPPSASRSALTSSGTASFAAGPTCPSAKAANRRSMTFSLRSSSPKGRSRRLGFHTEQAEA